MDRQEERKRLHALVKEIQKGGKISIDRRIYLATVYYRALRDGLSLEDRKALVKKEAARWQGDQR